jgi:hypothetical protein
LVDNVTEEVKERIGTQNVEYRKIQASTDTLSYYRMLLSYVQDHAANNAAQIRVDWSKLRQIRSDEVTKRPVMIALSTFIKEYDSYLDEMEGTESCPSDR